MLGLSSSSRRLNYDCDEAIVQVVDPLADVCLRYPRMLDLRRDDLGAYPPRKVARKTRSEYGLLSMQFSSLASFQVLYR